MRRHIEKALLVALITGNNGMNLNPLKEHSENARRLMNWAKKVMERVRAGISKIVSDFKNAYLAPV